MVPYLMRMTQRPALSVLMGAKSIRQIALWQTVIVMVIGILAWVFGEYFKLGLHGIVLGVAIPILFYNAIWHTRYVCRQLEIKWRNYMWQSYGRIILGSIPTAVVAVVLVRYAYPHSLAAIILEGLICMLVFAVIAWLFVFLPNERSQILVLLKRIPYFEKLLQ